MSWFNPIKTGGSELLCFFLIFSLYIVQNIWQHNFGYLRSRIIYVLPGGGGLENRYRVEMHVHSPIFQGQLIEKKLDRYLY